MANHQDAAYPRLWITYPWSRCQERDFSFLLSQLKDANIDAVYESLQLQPNSQLGRKVVQRLLSDGFDGWAYILTHQCFTQRAFIDELTAAIDHTLINMGTDFRMAGLMYGIGVQHVPPVLRILPCISLGDPDWKKQLSGIFLADPALGHRASPGTDEAKFVWKIHPCYDGDPSKTAVEVHPRDDRIQYWRFAIPKSARVTVWGQGRSGGGEISRIVFAEARGFGRHENRDVVWFGAANTISDTESAYAVFSGPLPDFVCFGPARSAFGSPGKMEMLRPGLLKHDYGL